MVRVHLHITDPGSDVEEEAANSTQNVEDLQLDIYAKAELQQGVHFQVKEGMLLGSTQYSNPNGQHHTLCALHSMGCKTAQHITTHYSTVTRMVSEIHYDAWHCIVPERTASQHSTAHHSIAQRITA